MPRIKYSMNHMFETGIAHTRAIANDCSVEEIDTKTIEKSEIDAAKRSFWRTMARLSELITGKDYSNYNKVDLSSDIYTYCYVSALASRNTDKIDFIHKINTGKFSDITSLEKLDFAIKLHRMMYDEVPLEYHPKRWDKEIMDGIYQIIENYTVKMDLQYNLVDVENIVIPSFKNISVKSCKDNIWKDELQTAVKKYFSQKNVEFNNEIIEFLENYNFIEIAKKEWQKLIDKNLNDISQKIKISYNEIEEIREIKEYLDVTLRNTFGHTDAENMFYLSYLINDDDSNRNIEVWNEDTYKEKSPIKFIDNDTLEKNSVLVDFLSEARCEVIRDLKLRLEDLIEEWKTDWKLKT